MTGRAVGRAAGLVLPGLVLGGTLVAAGTGMLACAGVGLTGDGRAIGALAIPGGATLAAGLFLLAAYGGKSFAVPAIRPAHGFAAVTLAWVGAALAGCIPLIAAGSLTSPIDAYFEAMSGFTTTGATLIERLEPEPDAILMWRQTMQWLGGIGIVVLVVAIAPVSGAAIQRVFFAEVSGITTDRLTPRIADTAKIIGTIYLILTGAVALAYLATGLDAFDAVAHAFTSIATGGFSTRTQSIAAFDSVSVEIVTIIAMILGAINFAFYWRAIRGGTARPQLTEVLSFLAIVVAGIAVATAGLVLSEDVTFGDSLRGAAFSVTSAATTTGFTTVDFNVWHDVSRFTLLTVMIVGGCAGSTAGGMKVIRVLLLGRTAGQEVNRQLQPQSVKVLRLGGRAFPESVRAAVMGFALVYVLLLLVGAFGFAATGLGFETAASASISSLTMFGPGLGEVGPAENFTALSPEARVFSTVLMLIGRLEVFTVVALFAAIRLAVIHRR